MLFAFQPTRACIFDISADQNVRLRSALPSLRLYGNSLFCDRLRLFAICDRLRSYGNQPLDRTWFYLLRSSAITIAGSETIAEVFPYDRRPYCDLRSAICDPRSYGNQPLQRLPITRDLRHSKESDKFAFWWTSITEELKLF